MASAMPPHNPFFGEPRHSKFRRQDLSWVIRHLELRTDLRPGREWYMIIDAIHFQGVWPDGEDAPFEFCVERLQKGEGLNGVRLSKPSMLLSEKEIAHEVSRFVHTREGFDTLVFECPSSASHWRVKIFPCADTRC